MSEDECQSDDRKYVNRNFRAFNVVKTQVAAFWVMYVIGGYETSK
jgi:hypothetical protein